MTKRIILFMFTVLFLLGCEELTDDIVLEGRERLEGPWRVNEESQVFKSTLTSYNIFISVDSTTSNRVIIENFYGANEGEVSAIVSGQSITVPNQSLGDYQVLSANGTINDDFDEISWNYVVDLSETTDTATAVYIKQ